MSKPHPTETWTWSQEKPRRSEYREFLEKCGPQCFLDPNRPAFPICNRACQIDCDGLRAAYVRARALVSSARKIGREDLAKYYEDIANRAKQIAQSIGCLWARGS